MCWFTVRKVNEAPFFLIYAEGGAACLHNDDPGLIRSPLRYMSSTTEAIPWPANWRIEGCCRSVAGAVRDTFLGL
jgi:hypothetical protein